MASRRPTPKPVETHPLQIDGVTTVAGLAKESRSLAYIRPDGKYQVTDAGHKRLGRELRALAQYNLENGVRHSVNRDLP